MYCTRYHHNLTRLLGHVTMIRSTMPLIYVLVLAFFVGDVVRASCPDGWVQHRAKCYYFSSFDDVFTNAAAYCLISNAQLAEPVDAEEVDFLQSKVKAIGNKDFFIGVVDYFVQGSWMYLSTASNVSVTNWLPTEPNSAIHANPEDCVIMSGYWKGKWADVNCGTYRRFICETYARMPGGILLG